MAKIYHFVVRTPEGDVEYSARGREGAMERAIHALSKYRGLVARGSGMLHGNPLSMGWIEVDGIRGIVSVTDHGMTDSVIETLDRLGVDAAKAFYERCAADVEAGLDAYYQSRLDALDER